MTNVDDIYLNLEKSFTYRLYHVRTNALTGPPAGGLLVTEVEKANRRPVPVLASATVAVPTRSLLKESADFTIRDVIVAAAVLSLSLC